MKPTLVELQSPSGYGKVPFAMSGPPNSTNTGDIHKNNYKNIQGDKKSTQQVNYGKTTHFISKYSCWSPQGIRGDLDFSYAYHFFTSTCAQWANFFFQGRKFEIDLRDKQKQIEFLFPAKST